MITWTKESVLSSKLARETQLDRETKYEREIVSYSNAIIPASEASFLMTWLQLRRASKVTSRDRSRGYELLRRSADCGFKVDRQARSGEWRTARERRVSAALLPSLSLSLFLSLIIKLRFTLRFTVQLQSGLRSSDFSAIAKAAGSRDILARRRSSERSRGPTASTAANR